jgi:hypothetical protein
MYALYHRYNNLSGVGILTSNAVLSPVLIEWTLLLTFQWLRIVVFIDAHLQLQ